MLALASVDRKHRRSTTARLALAAGLASAAVLAFWATTDAWPDRLIIAAVAAVAIASLTALTASRFWSTAQDSGPIQRVQPTNGSIHPFSKQESSTKITKL